MKPPCATFEFMYEREQDLLRAYQEQIHLQLQKGQVILDNVFREVAEMPSRRFWVSSERASVVIAQMLKGKCPKMRPTKKAMFDEIYKRVLKLREKYKYKPLIYLVEMVVTQEAPSFYLTPVSVKLYIFKAKKRKKEWLRERKKKLRHLF